MLFSSKPIQYKAELFHAEKCEVGTSIHFHELDLMKPETKETLYLNVHNLCGSCFNKTSYMTVHRFKENICSV